MTGRRDGRELGIYVFAVLIVCQLFECAVEWSFAKRRAGWQREVEQSQVGNGSNPID